MMLLDQLWQAVPGLQAGLERLELVEDREQAWLMLRKLLGVPAPSSGVTLPGAIFDEVTDIAAMLGLADRISPDLAATGNGVLWVGVDKPGPDLVVITHMDRPTFTVLDTSDARLAVLNPVCRELIPADLPPLPARAYRYDLARGTLKASAQGYLMTMPEGGRPVVRFQVERGRLSEMDLVTLDVPAMRQGDVVSGSGLNNCAGLLMALGAAAVLRQIEETLLEQNRQCVFLFTERRDSGLSAATGRGGHGGVVPTVGTVIVDAHAASASGVQPGKGVSYAFHATQPGGPHVPVNYRQLSADLSAAFNTQWPDGTQHNQLYYDPALPGQTRVVGLIGVPVEASLGEQEQMNLRDLQAGTAWLTCYLALSLGLVPAARAQYALGR